MQFGDIVYLKTDPDQLERIVTGKLLRPGGVTLYELCCGIGVSIHYDFEISEDIDVLKQVRNGN
jgi:hypothetical protein